MIRRLASERGMTLFTVLFAIVLIGLILGLAGRTSSEIMQVAAQPPGTTLPPPPQNSNNPL